MRSIKFVVLLLYFINTLAYTLVEVKLVFCQCTGKAFLRSHVDFSFFGFASDVMISFVGDVSLLDSKHKVF